MARCFSSLSSFSLFVLHPAHVHRAKEREKTSGGASNERKGREALNCTLSNRWSNGENVRLVSLSISYIIIATWGYIWSAIFILI